MKKITAKDVMVGDYLYIDGESSFCDGGYERVVDILTKYDVDTGEPYKVFVTDSGSWFSDKGLTIKGPTAYSVYGYWRK